MAESRLLRAEEALVPFDPARRPELDALHHWLNDDTFPVAVRLLTGDGGVGKTRITLELCKEATDWHAGILDSCLQPENMKTAWESLIVQDRPLLIVIDYAETRQLVLLDLLKAMLRKQSKHNVRILLLARDAGEWWESLPSRESDCEALLNGGATVGPVKLRPLHSDPSDRARAYENAVKAFAAELGLAIPSVIPDLSDEHFAHPLYLQMTALLAFHGERPSTRDGLTKAILNHERRYWRATLADLKWHGPEHYAQQMLALIALTGGFSTPKELKPYWRAIVGDEALGTSFSTLWQALVALYPGKHGLEPMRPDLLAEALVAQTLRNSHLAAGLLDAVLSSKAERTVRHHSLTILTRLSADRLDLHEPIAQALTRNLRHCFHEALEVARQTKGPLVELLREAFTSLVPSAKSQAAGLLAPLLEDESVALAGLAYDVFRFRYNSEKDKRRQNKWSHQSMVDFANVLREYSVAAFRDGRMDEAAELSEKAVNAYRTLADKDPGNFRGHYAGCLNNYATGLSEIGRHDVALTHIRDALEIYRKLAEARPDRFEPDFAMSLNTYAIRLSDVGQYEPALEHALQALEIYRRLAGTRPDRFEPDVFSVACNASLQQWLSSNLNPSPELEKLPVVPESIRPHQREAAKAQVIFVAALVSRNEKTVAFAEVISTWQRSPAMTKFRMRDYFLCSAAWCEKFAQKEVTGVEWHAILREYVAQHGGRLPQWMVDVAVRLGFDWKVQD